MLLLIDYHLSGLYFHIPFCKQSCIYCNFYFKNGRKHSEEFIEALLNEIDIKLNGNTADFRTLYFGGGTPSFLEPEFMSAIFNKLSQYTDISAMQEVTLEANPDDMSIENLKFWKSLGITRFSVGIQSFYDEHLKWMNRAHSSEEADKALRLAGEMGFDLSIDLIFGIPGCSNEQWLNNLKKALTYNIQHISCYGLTLEDKTPWKKLISSKGYVGPDDAQSSEQFELCMTFLQENGWQHYEISNYCLPGKAAVHNTAYWQNLQYIGFGPSAHSYDGHSRSWNIADLRAYSEALMSGNLPETREILSATDQYNEYVMTGLRTMWGISYTKLLQMCNNDIEVQQHLQKHLNNGDIIMQDDTLVLSKKGKLYADAIASDLFM